LKNIYGTSLALLTDLYELTMAYGYWKRGLKEKEAVFHLNFRRSPFQGTFAIAAGLECAMDYIQRFKFDAEDLSYLATLEAKPRKPLFEQAFLDELEQLSFTLDIDAVPEGTPVFPYQPLLRVQGPIIQAQILESVLLNIINFQSLIATKAARICWAAKPDPIVEFGLRRAQGIDGAISASRAAYIGGCESTSHVLAGKLFGIPVRGTHAHSWVMLFRDEATSFREFAMALPEQCVFLIDTYSTLNGVKKAIEVANSLKEEGFNLFGVRLDSGDLAFLSQEVRNLLDGAGYFHTKIMASNELDEYIISDLKTQQGAKIDIWGVGTNLVTGKSQPALDGIYKLSAVRDPGGPWEYRVKISDQLAKVTNPGILQVRRFWNEKGYIADMLYDIHGEPISKYTVIDPSESAHRLNIEADTPYQDLLVPVMRRGKLVYTHPALSDMRRKTEEELGKFPERIRRFLNPQPYFAGIEKGLLDMKLSLIEEMKP
jgi:nicotinate phosphoribosyltransferase